ncbi:hypothetical protein [Burkholderia gladioli]|uniref:hypothetical protein n=1 Tax=Burkholderia gladioli TaxID=28095 RepID=UPI0011B23218|nr:hypothetical protein [Burkholderia gladioli]MBU9173993.1 hypothetical protein [Burkholderia gladioli]
MNENDQNQTLDELADRWAWWCMTRRLFVPPVKSNVLARMQPPRNRLNVEPDAFLDPEMPFLNMAIHAMCEQGEHRGIAECFVGVYWYRTNIKALAGEQGCARGTVYNRARSFIRSARSLARVIRETHEAMTESKCSISVEQNSAFAD